MTLQERLGILKKQYKQMTDYRLLCNSHGSTLQYSNEDYNREGMLIEKIHQTKDWLNGKRE